MTTACTIRRLDRDDAESWAVLRLEALENHPLAFGASVPEDPKTLADFFRVRLTSNEASAVFGAFIDSAMIGILGVERSIKVKEQHKATLWGMYVTARSRRNGAGELLMRAAISYARAWSGVEQVQLAVSEAAGEAQKLYEKVGFRAWGREPRSLCWKGQCADEIYMFLDLRQL